MPFGGDFVVQGRTMEGLVFQPQNWAEQLCAEIAQTREGRGAASLAFVHPVAIDGISSLVVLEALKETDAQAFDMIRQFIVDHHLMVRAGRGGAYIETTGAFPVIGRDRRHSSYKNQ